MRKTLLFLIVLFVSALLGACTDDADSNPDNEGFVLKIEEDRVLVAKDISSEEYNEVKDKTVSEFEGPDEVPLIYLSYDDANKFDKGDEVEFWIDGGVNDSYPQQAGAKKISLIE